MGIKFHCPNGHKLNVKAFLAGKRGVCPKCGTKVRIPTESEQGLDSDLEEEEAGGSSISKNNGSGAAAIRTAPRTAGTATAAAAGTATTLDPIEENPAAIWYVRPFTGGQYGQQYGPAKGDVMRKWLTEGRVSSDSLVWREGWTDWQNAAKVFPELESGSSPPAVAPPQASASPASPPSASAPIVSTTAPLLPKTSPRTTVRYDSKKPSASGLAIGILVGLGILSLILTGVLVYFVMNLK